MTNNPNKDMQEALDATLSPEAYRKMLQDMKNDPEASADFQKLQSAEGMLREARTRPAPNSIMDGIMAKIAQPEALPVPQSLISRRALAIGLGVVAAVSLPILTAISLTILTLFGTGSALSGMALGVIGVVMFLVTMISGTVSNAHDLIMNYPLILGLLLLIPVAWYGLWHLGKSWAE